MAERLKKYRAGKAAAANTSASRNEKAAQAKMTIAGASVIGGPAAVGTIGLGMGLSALSHSRAAKADRAKASRETARSNAIENVKRKSSGGAATGFDAANQKFNAGKAAAPGPQASSDASSGDRPGWSNKARIAAAVARGAENLPYGGNPDDGTA